MSARADAVVCRLRHTAAIARLIPAYGVFRVLRHVVPLPVLARWAWRPAAEGVSAGKEALTVARVAWLRRHAGSSRGDCLPASLVLYRELSGMRTDVALVVGMRGAALGLEGHAWVTAAAVPVGEDSGEVASYEPALTFSERGRLSNPSRIARRTSPE